jgi:hypothetical protein
MQYIIYLEFNLDNSSVMLSINIGDIKEQMAARIRRGENHKIKLPI